ncbi:MAG TPA: hypothetical protein VN867_02185 [Candidatus Binataceae bacterium]|nr:hypothetical protein [Candidatus Binataceae bacterium]
MRTSIILLGLASLAAAGCLTYSAPPPPPTTMTAWSPTGGFPINSGGNCAGQITMLNGFATVNDPCFTGSFNVVLCSDTTAPHAVQCTPSIGALSLSGSASDTIAYARVK